MTKYLEKISLNTIFIGIAITLAVPLVVGSNFFFPFVFPKAVVFRLAVEVMLVAYLVLLWKNSSYAPKLNIISGSLLGFGLIAFISSIFGANFVNSFWGDMERSEGLILWLHLIPYFLIVSSVLNNRDRWFRFFDLSIVFTLFLSFFALGQMFEWKAFLSPGGTRVSATLGNAAFFAAYLIPHIFLAGYLFFERKQLWQRSYYALATILFITMLFQTEVRGAMLGLIGAGFSIALLAILNNQEKPVIRKTSVIILTLIFLSAVGVYAVRNQSWVANYPTLKRLASISAQEKTAQTRLVTWDAAWKGSQDRLLLGYGLENFNVVFDQNFPTSIYQRESSEVWFDRAHNFVFDRLTTVGALGLLLYLIFLWSPLYFVYKYWYRTEENKILGYSIFGLIVAYTIQNFFVFETVSTYVILMFVWAWFGYLVGQATNKTKIIYQALAVKILAIIALLGILPTVYFVNILPAQANESAAVALNMSRSGGEEIFFETVALYKKAIEKNTYGNPEYQIELSSYIGGTLAPLGEVYEQVYPVIEYVDEQIDDLINKQGDDVKSFLVAMRHYNYTHKSLAGKEQERLEKALSYFDRAKELSPTRPHVYQEAGYSYLYLARLKKGEESSSYFALAKENFQKTIDLNPLVVESHLNLIALYLETNNEKDLEESYDNLLASRGSGFAYAYNQRLVQTAAKYERFDWVVKFAKNYADNNPENIDGQIQLLLSYAHAQMDQEARGLAEVIRQKWPAESSAIDEFLEELDSGVFKK
jgi:O-antigen ligase